MPHDNGARPAGRIRETQEFTLRDLEARYHALTGRPGYLYAYSPGDQYGKRYVFTGDRPSFGINAALTRMRGLLAVAELQRDEAEAAAERERAEADFEQRYITFSDS